LLDEAGVDQLLEDAAEALLGDLEDVEEVRDPDAGMAIDEMDDAVMRPPKAITMNAISGRSSAVKGSATLVMDPVAAFRPAVSSGFKFTSVMLTYFHPLSTKSMVAVTVSKTASHRSLIRPSCRAHHNDDCAATQKMRWASDCDTFSKPPYV